MGYIGIGFPFSRKSITGFAEIKADIELIADSFLQIFKTKKGERYKRVDFGVDLPNQIFENNDEVHRQLIMWDMLLAAERWEQRATINEFIFTDTDSDKEQGLVKIAIAATLNKTGEPMRLSYYWKDGEIFNDN